MKKGIIGFVLGAIIFGGIVGVSAYTIFANDIGYTPNDTTWKKSNGEDITNVKDAIDDLYTKASDNAFCEEWTEITGSTVTNTSYVYNNSINLYKCGHVCKLSFALDGTVTNTDYKIITDERYYPTEEVSFTGAGHSSGYASLKLKTDGNLVITFQSFKNGWASGSTLYLCNN